VGFTLGHLLNLGGSVMLKVVLKWTRGILGIRTKGQMSNTSEYGIVQLCSYAHSAVAILCSTVVLSRPLSLMGSWFSLWLATFSGYFRHSTCDLRLHWTVMKTPTYPCAKLHDLYLETKTLSYCINDMTWVIWVMASLTVLFRFLYVGFVRNRQGRLTEWSRAFDKGRSELCYNKLVHTVCESCAC